MPKLFLGVIVLEKNQKKGIYIAAIICAISIAAIIITLSYVFKTSAEQPTKWVLSSYGNNVALYNKDGVVEVYGTITLDNLPVADRKRIENGIVFKSKEEALSAIEDYDG